VNGNCRSRWMLCLLVAAASASVVGVSARAADPLPPAAQKEINFGKDVRVILAHNCLKCHAGDKKKGGLSLASRDDTLRGGKTGPGAIIGKSAESELIKRVVSHDPDEVMPPEGKPLSGDEVSVLRAWIDQGLKWDALDPKSFDQNSILPRPVQVAPGAGNAIDRLLVSYFQQHAVKAEVVSDEVFCRRAYLDIVGLLPTPQQLKAFLDDAQPDKRERLIHSLLDDKVGYAAHWITFWQDLLRDGKKDLGTTDIFRPITNWLYASLLANKPYDQFVRELVNPAKLRALHTVTAGEQDDSPKDAKDDNPPADDASGFVAGVQGGLERARGDQQWEVQAVQNTGQVFLGVQLKCATCHDSFIDNWTMKDSWGLASVYTEKPLEMIRCEIPTGNTAAPAFLFPAVGRIDPSAPVPQRRAQLAALMTSPKNGRFARTVVNRLWGRLLGTPLVGTPDDMGHPAWNADVLDLLANDLAEHGYDLKRTIALIATSRAYQMPAVDGPGADKPDYVFRGPQLRRMTAEQFMDGLSALLGRDGPAAAATNELKPGAKPKAQVTAATQPTATKGATAATKPASPAPPDAWRVWRENGSRLLEVLGRPDRRTVITNRDAKSSTMQALELINGPSLYALLYGAPVPEDEKQAFADPTALGKAATQPGKAGKAATKPAAPANKPATVKLATLPPGELVDRVIVHALSRQPTVREREVYAAIVGEKPTPESVADLLWVVAMLPEFQLIR
jgi:hypothetical protein